jgi:hypothetical protein
MLNTSGLTGQLQVFEVDLRLHGQIWRGLLWALKNSVTDDERLVRIVKRFIRSVPESNLGGVADLLDVPDVSKVLEGAGTSVAEAIFLCGSVPAGDVQALLALVEAMVEELGAFTLVLDEANIAFSICWGTSSDEPRRRGRRWNYSPLSRGSASRYMRDTCRRRATSLPIPAVLINHTLHRVT